MVGLCNDMTNENATIGVIYTKRQSKKNQMV